MKKFLILLSKLFFIYCFSGGFYLMVETIFRGYSFMEMYYLAGFLGLLAYFLNNIFSYEMDFLLQMIVCTTVGTLGEGVVGIIFNSDHHIWDYRNLPLSFFFDQCNLMFVGLWFLLFLFAIPILDYVGWKCWNEEKPYYKIFGKKFFEYKD